MRVFGLSIQRAQKALTKAAPRTLSGVDTRGGWWRIVESVAGAWQKNVEVSTDTVLTYAAVYACVRLIVTDVGKLRIKLDEESSPGIWTETKNSAYSPVLRKPNHYQTRIQFIEQWCTSKQLHGNAYVIKVRDNRKVVTALYVLDALRVRPLVAPNSDVYYRIEADPLSRLPEGVTIPASEIMHDRMLAPYHPLVGLSPISVCGLAATQGLSIQNNSTRFFTRGLQPPGILTTVQPLPIDDEEVVKIQEHWERHFSGDNAGRIAVLGNDLKYQPLSMSAVDSQLIEQLKWTAAEVCTAFGVPAYMIGVGPWPSYNNVEALTQGYYQQCIQTLIENIEALLDEGLGLSEQLGTELDLGGLLRMDTASRVTAAKESANGGGMTFNEVREQFHGLGPIAGGDVVLAQTQNASLDFIKRRDEIGPVSPQEPAAKPAAPAAAVKAALFAAAVQRKALEHGLYEAANEAA